MVGNSNFVPHWVLQFLPQLSVHANSLQSCLFVTLWTVALKSPLSMGFSRQEYWSGLPCPPPGDLPNPVIEPKAPTLQADSLPSEPPGKPIYIYLFLFFASLFT